MSSRPTGIDLLHHVLFKTNKKVLFITGAGISVKSGVPLYRSSKTKSKAPAKEPSPEPRRSSEPVESPEGGVIVHISDDEGGSSTFEKAADQQPAASESDSEENHPAAIWDYKLETLANNKIFILDPRSWYEHFWFDTHHVAPLLTAVPNESHFGIAVLNLSMKERVKCITQNVDNLHQKAGIDKAHLIEIHGSIGLYRCSSSQCPEKRTRVLRARDLHFLSAKEEAQYLQRVSFTGRSVPDIQEWINKIKVIYAKEVLAKKTPSVFTPDHKLPCCPKCRFPAMPFTLLFDETYYTNDHFRMDEAQRWVSEADVLVFCGTSLSVNFPMMAVAEAMRGSKLVFNINLEVQDEFRVFTDLSRTHRSNVLHDDQVAAGTIEMHFDSFSDGSEGSHSEPEGTTPVQESAETAAPMDMAKACEKLLEDAKEGPSIMHILMPADKAIMMVLDGELRKACEDLLARNELRKQQRLWEAP